MGETSGRRGGLLLGDPILDSAFGFGKRMRMFPGTPDLRRLWLICIGICSLVWV